MFYALESNEDLATAQQKFENAFVPYEEGRYEVVIGFRGENTKRTVSWMPRLNLWAYFGFPLSKRSRNKRYWHGFGLGKPYEKVSIDCTINFPVDIEQNPTAALFVTDRNSRLLVLHRGKFTISGGIRKDFVLRHYKGELISFMENGKCKKAMKVTEIPSNDFGYQVQHFVMEIQRIKNLARKRRT